MTALFVVLILQAPAETNHIVFLVDDLGWTGLEQADTPHLDKLAKQGLRFTNAYAACTVCSPTRAALLTGQYPARLHVTDWIHGHKRKNAPLDIPKWTHYLDHKHTTIPEALPDHVSCHIGKWHLGAKKHWPKTQGFHENIGGYLRGQPPSYFSPYRIPTLKDGPKGEYLTERLAREACGFLERSKAKPFFLYFAFYTVHTPLQAKPELVKKYKGDRFKAMVESMDAAVGAVLKKLDELGLSKKTSVCFTSDNGGLSHIYGKKYPVTDNSPLRLGKGSEYEGGVRVPMIVRWPGLTKPGTTCHEPVISTDFFPTITGRRSPDGKDLKPLLKDPAKSLNRDLFWHYPHYHPGGATPYGAIRSGRWKLIEFYEDNRIVLFDLKEDIGEQHDLTENHREVADELHGKLRAWRKAVGAQMPTPKKSKK